MERRPTYAEIRSGLAVFRWGPRGDRVGTGWGPRGDRVGPGGTGGAGWERVGPGGTAWGPGGTGRGRVGPGGAGWDRAGPGGDVAILGSGYPPAPGTDVSDKMHRTCANNQRRRPQVASAHIL